MSSSLLLALVLGLVIGALLGLLGGGGSILAVPALVYGLNQPLAVAVPTSLLVVGVSSAAAVLPRLRQVQWRLAAIFGATGAAAAFAGTALNQILDPSIVLLGFAAVMVAAALRMLRSSDDVGGSCALPGGGVNWRSCLPKAAVSGLVVGLLTGLFGVGGEFLIIPMAEGKYRAVVLPANGQNNQTRNDLLKFDFRDARPNDDVAAGARTMLAQVVVWG